MKISDAVSLSRRRLLQGAGAVAATPATAQTEAPSDTGVADGRLPRLVARWIWYPARRTPPGTFVFFRRTFVVSEIPGGPALAWITANSRYVLFVNGKQIQRGPAPCDPRVWDVDPVDLAPHLHRGRNIIAVLVCYFGHGEGTWVPNGVPGLASGGLLFQSEQWPGCGDKILKTDRSWRCALATCWRCGSSKRWYLRALQEEFDARLYPAGWEAEGFADGTWEPARELDIPSNSPLIFETGWEGRPSTWKLVPRSIPPLKEMTVLPMRISQAGWIDWQIAPETYFSHYPEHAYTETPDGSLLAGASGGTLFPILCPTDPSRTTALTFEFPEEVVGYIRVRLRAVGGTIIHLQFTESASPTSVMLPTTPAWSQWALLVTREGESRFETFDFEAIRFVQLLIRGTGRPVEILEVSVTRRQYAYEHYPDLKSSDLDINRTLDAAVNTHLNVAQDTLVDNMVRERQQWAGEIDSLKLSSYYGFGEYRQAERMLRTFAMGQSPEGWFMGCWPSHSGGERLWQSHLGMTRWGALVDHALSHALFVVQHHLFTGNRRLLEELYPRFVAFYRWLVRQEDRYGLLPISGQVWTAVWIDHQGYKSHADKHCAYNLLYIGFLREGLARLADWMADTQLAQECRHKAGSLAAALQRQYWSGEEDLYIDNLPRTARDGELRCHDRTLSMALLFGALPAGHGQRSLDLLSSIPTDRNGPLFPLTGSQGVLGFSHPANAHWRLWALGRFGRAESIVRDLRERWRRMPSLALNNTFSERWEPQVGGGGAWCQACTSPLFILYSEILGVRPTAPGFDEFDLRPQPGGLEWIYGTVHTVRGALRVECRQRGSVLSIQFNCAWGARPAVVLPAGWRVRGLPETTQTVAGPVPGTERHHLLRTDSASTIHLEIEPK